MAVRDLFIIAIVLLALSLGFFTMYYTFGKVTEAIRENPQINSSANAMIGFNSIDTTMTRLDYIVFSVFIGLVISLIITSWFIASHPIFTFIYFIGIIILVIASAVFANVWESFTQSGKFGSTINAFPLSNQIMLNLPLYMAVIGFIGMVVMFGKPYFRGVE